MSNNEEGRHQRLLTFDTSTSNLAVSIMDNNQLLSEVNILAERNHSAYLVTAIQDCLHQAGLQRSDLDGIAVGIGPGSYTGIRIAVTTAKTLAWALDLPVVGISSLEATALGGWATETRQQLESLKLVEGQGHANHWIIPLVDARRGQVYTALFGASEGAIPRRLERDGIRLMKDWIEELVGLYNSLPVETRPSAIYVVGEIGSHGETAEEMRNLIGDNLYIIPYELEGRWVGASGAYHFQLGERDEVHGLEPNYTQLAEAEAARLRKA